MTYRYITHMTAVTTTTEAIDHTTTVVLAESAARLAEIWLVLIAPVSGVFSTFVTVTTAMAFPPISNTNNSGPGLLSKAVNGALSIDKPQRKRRVIAEIPSHQPSPF